MEDPVGFKASVFVKLSVGVVSLVAAASFTGCIQTSEMITFSAQQRAKGIEFYDQQNIEKATGAFRDAVRQNPRDYISFYYLGKIYADAGNEQLASQSFRASLRVKSQTDEGQSDEVMDTPITDAAAMFTAKAQSRDAEIAAWEQLAQTSRSAIDWLVVAKTYAFSGDGDSAIASYDRAVMLDPNNLHVLKPFGLYLEKIGQKQRADAVLRRAYQLNQEDAEVNDGLRRLGIIPGPALLQDSQLQRPLIPRGPIPEMK
jgi:Tfp pilus assembly protein PilF